MQLQNTCGMAGKSDFFAKEYYLDIKKYLNKKFLTRKMNFTS